MKFWQSFSNSKALLPTQWLFYSIAAIGILISVLLWYALTRQSNDHLDDIVQIQVEHVKEDIILQFDRRITALKHTAKHLELDTDPYSTTLRQNSIMLVGENNDFQAFAWVDQSHKIPYHFALDDQLWSRLAPQILALNLPNVESFAILASNDNVGLIFVYPLKKPNGFIVAYSSLNTLLNPELNLSSFHISIFQNGQLIFKNQTKRENHHTVNSAFNWANLNWQIHITPSAKVVNDVQTYLPFIALMLGLTIAILFALTTFLARLAAERARSLFKSNAQLKKEMVERIQSEESRQKLERALLQGQKLQAIGTLAGGIAHDFNNILYAIIGFAEMAREDVKQEGLLYQNLSKVIEASHRGRDLVARILAFSRRQPLEFKLIPLCSTLDNVLALLKPTIPASITLNFKSRLEDCQIIGNPTQLHQVVVNLINNAVDAMDGEGTITITLERITKDDPILNTMLDKSTGTYCKLTIKDTGHGMSPSTIQRIFEPFYTTKEVGKGTGLGLSTAHAIIKDHKGEILVTSELGKGSCFTILLPEYVSEDKGEENG